MELIIILIELIRHEQQFICISFAIINLKMKVLIADDHSIIRKGMKIHLQSNFLIDKIEEVKSCSQVMNILLQRDFTHLILDLMLIDGSSLEILPNIKQLYPQLRILVYSMQPEIVYKPLLKKYGVYYFIAKASDEEQFNLKLNNFFNNYSESNVQEDIVSKNPFTKLTPREMEIIFYLLRGQSTKETSELLNVTMSTISTTKQKILEKVNAKNVKELTDLATIHQINY